MKLIDADALRKDVLALPNCYNGYSDTYDKSLIIGLIDEQIAVDAVTVVRCADCSYFQEDKWNDWNDDRDGTCCWWDGQGTMYRSFCGYGERRSDGTERSNIR